MCTTLSNREIELRRIERFLKMCFKKELSVSEFVFYLFILSVLLCAGFCCISIDTVQNTVDKII